MNNLLVLVATGFFLAAILVGMFTSSESWKGVILSCSLLVVGLTFFCFGLMV